MEHLGGLCTLCRQIRPAHPETNWEKHVCITRHHSTFSDLIESASNGCALCELFKPFVEAAVKRRNAKGKCGTQNYHLNDTQSTSNVDHEHSASALTSAPHTGSLETPFRSRLGKGSQEDLRTFPSLPTSISYAIEGNDAYYYRDRCREKEYGEPGEDAYSIRSIEGEQEVEREVKFVKARHEARKVIKEEDEEERSYWKNWTAPGPKPWDAPEKVRGEANGEREGAKVDDAGSRPPSPSQPISEHESGSAATNPILQWLFTCKGSLTGPEQLWVHCWHYSQHGLPNPSQNGISAIVKLSAGSITVPSSIYPLFFRAQFCCDGIFVPNLHVLATTFPGLWKYRYDDLGLPGRKSRPAIQPTFEFFQSRENVQSLDPPILGRDVVKDPSSEACFIVAKDWISNCERNHPNCELLEHTKIFPSRLLKVGTQECPLLHLTSGSICAADERYAALSHCWGDANAVTKLTAASLHRWIGSMDEAILSPNFRDAVAITRGLGIPYLWIDALCIVQDDRADWDREASMMGLYYRHASLVISAVSSPDTLHGILNERSSDDSAVPTPHIGENVAIRLVLEEALSVMDPRFTHLERKLASNLPLKMRAWTMQERIFARRILHYTQQQMVWQCKTCLFGEDGQLADLDPINKPTKDGFNKDLLHFAKFKPTRENPNGLISLMATGWFNLLQYYTARFFTFPSDLLPGIAGLAREVAQVTECTYYAGIWWGSQNVHLDSLLWRVWDDEIDRCPQRMSFRAVEYYEGCEAVPSWSWASLTGRIAGSAFSSDLLKLEIDAVFKRPSITPVSSVNPFGSVMPRGYMETSGYMYPYDGHATFTEELAVKADYFYTEVDHTKLEFAVFDISDHWDMHDKRTSLKVDGQQDESSEALLSVDGQSCENCGPLEAKGGREYAGEQLFLLYVVSHDTLSWSKLKIHERQNFLILQRRLKGYEGTDTEKHWTYRRVGVAETPTGMLFKIGPEWGWKWETFRFY